MRLGLDTEEEKVVGRRTFMLGGGLALVTAGLAGRLYQLQIVEAEAFRTLAEDNRFNYRITPPPRGLILDRAGRAVAGLRDNLRILASPEQIADPEALLRELAPILRLSEVDLARVRRDLADARPFTPVVVKEDLTWADFSAVNVRAPDLPGLIADVTQVRDYPLGAGLSHVVGYVGAAGEADGAEDDPLLRQPGFKIGKAGVEDAFDEVLRGEAGALKVEVNARGRVIREIPDPSTAPKPGGAVALSIDADLQSYVTKRLEGESAAVSLMDLATGDLMALASTPGFDPNLFTVALTQKAWRGLLDDPLRPLNDKALSGLFPPGSTFKMIVALAALREGVAPPDETVNCLGKIRFGDREFNCWRPYGHGEVDMHDAIKRSCDVYFYELGKRLGPEPIKKVAEDYGLGATYDLPIRGEKTGLLPDDAWKREALGEPWYGGESLNLGIGQGYLLTTPLQLCVMAARLATGRKITPRLVRAVDGEVAPAPDFPPIAETPGGLALIRRAMDAVVNDLRGTAPKGRLEDYRLAGKTGTAQVRGISKAEREEGVRENEDLPWRLRDHALFVAFAPTYAPTFAISVVVEHGGGGASAAAPVARDVMAEALRLHPPYGPFPLASAAP